MHFCISLFIMDGVSDLTMRRQLSILYEDPNAQLPACSLLYKDYCLSLTGAQDGAKGSSGLAASAEYQAAKAFWWDRVPQLPPPPELPMLVAPGQRRPTGEFSHIGAVLSAEMFSRLKACCAARGVTPTSVMLTIYCLVLARFARHPRFLLNILHCLRHPVHEDVSKVTPPLSATDDH
jgi:mycobactin phenyloxazoline synthetase